MFDGKTLAKEINAMTHSLEGGYGTIKSGTAGMFAIAFAIDNLAQAISKGSENDKEIVRCLVDEVTKSLQS